MLARWVEVSDMPSDINRPIAKSLTIGMFASLALLLVGVVVQALRPESASSRVLPFVDALEASRKLQAGGWQSLGIFVLILTPVATLATTMICLLRNREWKIAAVAAAALALMIGPVVLSLR